MDGLTTPISVPSISGTGDTTPPTFTSFADEVLTNANYRFPEDLPIVHYNFGIHKGPYFHLNFDAFDLQFGLP